MERENRIVAYQSIIAGIRQIIVSGRKFYSAFLYKKIMNACVHNLNWTHFRSLLRISDKDSGIWYINEVSNEGYILYAASGAAGERRWTG